MCLDILRYCVGIDRSFKYWVVNTWNHRIYDNVKYKKCTSDCSPLGTMFKVAVQLSEAHISMQMSLKLVEMPHKLMLIPPKSCRKSSQSLFFLQQQRRVCKNFLFLAKPFSLDHKTAREGKYESESHLTRVSKCS